MSCPVKTSLLTLEDMKADETFKTLPIVRKNMQGINGVELYPSVYNRLVTRTKANVLLLEYETTEGDDVYTCEKDVENRDEHYEREDVHEAERIRHEAGRSADVD